MYAEFETGKSADTHREREREGLAGGYRFDDLSVNELVGERKVEG